MKHPTTSELIPSKNQTLYIITLYHTISTFLIQGSQKSIWVNKNISILKAGGEGNTPMDEAYNKTLEIPNLDTKLPEQQSSKTYHKNNQADIPPQIPSIEISEQS